MKRLYVAISHHGLGHLAQTAPVLNALHEIEPATEFVIRTALPRAMIEARLDFPFEQICTASDCNLVMHDAVRADIPASLAAYRAFHDGWVRRVATEARELERVKVDAVFSNVGYLPLAAAQRAGIPSMAMCSLNWADIFRHYLGREPEAAGLVDQMVEAYAGVRAFLKPEPSMPMPDLANGLTIPPVAQAGRNRSDELADRLRIASGQRTVLVGMGGIRYRPPVECWPTSKDMIFLVPRNWETDHPSIRHLDDSGMPFRDILASVDALITKPGYGSYVEAACGDVPVLTIPRADWPETAYLNRWLAAHGRMIEIPEAALAHGDLTGPLTALWDMPSKSLPAATGAAQAACHLQNADADLTSQA